MALLCKRMFQSKLDFLIWYSVALACCCSGRAPSQYLTSTWCTSQREGYKAWMPSWWPFFLPAASIQIASGLEQDRGSSLIKVLMIRLEAMICLSHHVLNLKHSDSQKEYGFGYLANVTTDTMCWWLCHKDGPYSECKEYPF